VEENTVLGGFGGAVMEYYEETRALGETRTMCLGIPDRFIEHGTREEQLADAGLDPQTIARKTLEFLKA
jgi:1-deoxy-D-xylulose-5-phosphate synthase